MFDQSMTVGDFDARWNYLNPSAGLSQLRAPDNHRVYLAITNGSAQNLFIGHDGRVSSTVGQYVVAPGDTTEWYWQRHGVILTLPWFIFWAAGASQIAWTETCFFSWRDQRT